MVSCMNTVTKWGESIAGYLSAGPELCVCWTASLRAKVIFMRMNMPNLIIKTKLIGLLRGSEPLGNREKVAKSTIK